MALLDGEQISGGQVIDADGRLIVVGPGGVAISGGTGGGGADPLSDGVPGGALPTRTLWIAAANGTILQGLQADATGRLRTVVEGTSAVSVSNFPVTQPVSGTVTVANPTANPETGLAKDTTLTGGTQKAINRAAAKGTTAAADVTSDATDANTQSLHVNLKGTHSAVPVTGTFWQATQPVSGTFWQATQPVSGTVTANAGTGTFTTSSARPGTGTQTSVASTITTNTTILAANAARLGATIYNESTAVLFILLGAGTESATIYTLQMAAGAYYEVPFGFTGIIKGHWASANGSARVMELT